MTTVTHTNPDYSKVSVSVGEFTEIRTGVSLGENITIGNRSVIESCKIGNNTRIWDDCSILGGNIGSGVNIGSHVRIGVGCILGDGCIIKDYVELAKQTEIPAGSKVSMTSVRSYKIVIPEPDPGSDKYKNFK